MAMVGRAGWPEADRRVVNGCAALDDGSFASVGQDLALRISAMVFSAGDDAFLCSSYDGQAYSIPASS